MKSYLEIVVINWPNNEDGLSRTFIIDSIMHRFHHCLISINLLNAIAISFPKYSREGRSLGDTIRFFGSVSSLNSLRHYLTKDLEVVANAEITDIKEVPSEITHFVSYKRVRDKKLSLSEIRRYRKRSPDVWTDDFLEKVLEDQNKLALSNSLPPYFNAKSSSTKSSYPFYIKESFWSLEDQLNFSARINPESKEITAYGVSPIEGSDILLPFF